jgi:predicted site-specific integrase-resolvase
MTRRAMTIANACQILGKSYNQTLRLILLGHLHGWQKRNGRWEIDAQSVERLRARHSQREMKTKVSCTSQAQRGGASRSGKA